MEIIKTPQGRLLAKASWEDQIFVEALPEDFGSWTLPKQRQYLKQHVVQKLAFKVARAKQKKVSSKENT